MLAAAFLDRKTTVDELIAEGWFAADNLSMMQQLGAIPAPQAA